MEKEKAFTLSTKQGCKRLLALFLVLILLFSFFARLIASDCGKIKISRVAFDSRGAVIEGALYYPYGTSDRDKLPGLVVMHGGGVAAGVMKGISEELAKRGFVVLNVHSYGVGTSEQPRFDDGNQGEEGFNLMATPAGMYDALNFLRSFNFVDQERLGLIGHSMGSRRAGYSAMLDCSYMTLNDMLINILYEEFGIPFTEDEITQDADAVAEAKLNPDQLKLYYTLREKCEEDFNTSIRAICLLGSDANLVGVMKPVSVAGFEVMRNCKTNIGIIDGAFDYNYKSYPTRDTTKEAWHTGSADPAYETWYILDDANVSSKAVGEIYSVSSIANQELMDAFDARTTRIFMLNKETHSENFFSNDTTADAVKYFEQVMLYNRGELADSSTKPLDSSKIVFKWRAAFNGLAMISMICFTICLAALLLKVKFFESCIGKKEIESVVPAKKYYWLINALVIVLGFLCMYRANKISQFWAPYTRFLPLPGAQTLALGLVVFLGVTALIPLCINVIKNKKACGSMKLEGLNIKLGVVNVLKTILLSCILLAGAYLTLVLIRDLFNQDYRIWMSSFTEMKMEYWRFIWHYAIILFPFYVLIGISTNYTIRSDIPEWKDTLIAVLVNSAGVWLCCLVNYLVCMTGAMGDTLFSNFQNTYGFMTVVPLTVYITRKLYKMTKSIWLGAAVNAMFVAWSLISSLGMSCDVYYGQTMLGSIFNW